MRLKLLFLLFFVYSFIWAQTTLTFSTPTTGNFKVPAGVTSLNVECWGGGGAGGGVSNLVSIFGGGGAGGGAYTRVATFGVTPAADLSYKVGAGGIGVDGNDGLNGESTFFSTIIANGGVGGKHGNTGSGAGGSGGAVSTGVSYSGGNGAAGVFIVLTALSSGGGGGSAGTGSNGLNANTTTGGAAVTGGGSGGNGLTVIGTNGISGNLPGGGGGGALGLLNAFYRGGNGGNGQIKVTYTCPTYGLTSPTTADNVCTNIATTSVVRLTGGASLPNGDYTVTYNRSNPAATGLTASMSVTGGTGIGTFTVDILSATISSNITVTNLTSESCTNTINTNNIVTINIYSAPTITTTGIANDICFDSASQTATLPYSVTTNTPVNYSIAWNTAAISAGLVNQGITTFAFSPGGGNLNTIAIPAGILPDTYTGTMTILSANCSATQAIQLTILPKPSAPIPGAVTEPTCDSPSGSLTLSGLPDSVTWLITQTGTASTMYTSTGISYLISNLSPGNYQFTIEYTGSCISSVSTNVVINSLVTNTYDSGWSEGTPTVNQNLVFNSNYSSTENITGCSCTVNSGVKVVINSNDTLTIQNAVVNNSGTLTFENNASLVQDNPAAVNSGDIIYKRTSSPVENYDFTYWSSPVAGQTLYNLSPNTRWDKYLSYTGTQWKEEQYGALVMAEGIGYIIRTPSQGIFSNGEDVAFPYSQEVEFIGVPNNGDISGQSIIAGNFYLIGNPYPSAISADAFLFTDPNNSAILDGTIYFWTHNTPVGMVNNRPAYSSSDYASYNGVGGTSTSPADSGGDAPSGNIAAGQSFFASASDDGIVMFNNGMRIQGDNNQFFKPAKAAKPNLLERHRLWLDMTNKEGAFKQLLIGYVDGGTNGYDGDFDGITFDGNTYIDFYSINQGSNLVIQGRSLPFNNSDTVPLGYRTAITGEFTISINKTDGILSNQSVYLEDKLTHTITELTQKDYVFTSSIGVFNNRFVLRYTNATLATDEFEQDNNVLVWYDKKSLRLNSSEKAINKVFVHDISGKLIYSNSEILTSEVVISNLKFKNEVLLLKIVLADNHIINKKIITSGE